VARFLPDSNNARLQSRLEIVLESYHNFHSGDPSAFAQLADASVQRIPFRRG
jgi:hypothetical protein